MRTLTEREVRQTVRSLREAGEHDAANQIECLWAEVRMYRDREAASMQLQHLSEL